MLQLRPRVGQKNHEYENVVDECATTRASTAPLRGDTYLFVVLQARHQ